mgnify:CR=1 FL=1
MASHAKAADISSLSFEAALPELETIVRTLEKGDSSLEEAIGAYDRGARLKAHCERKLGEAKARVDKISLGPDGGAQGMEPANLD